MKRIFLCIFTIIFAISIFSTAISVSADTVDTSTLEAVIEYAKTLKKTDYDVTAFTWNSFQAKIEEAEALCDSYNVSQSEIDSMEDNLLRNIELLIPINNNAGTGEETETDPNGVDKTELEALLSHVSTLQRDDYDVSDQQWRSFITLVAEARSVFNTEEVTQADIDMVVGNISSAMSYLNQNKIGNELDTSETGIRETSGLKPQESEIIVATESPKLEVKTEKVKETRPKSTTPFMQGGFIDVNCGSSIAISAVAVVGIIGAALAIKKKED